MRDPVEIIDEFHTAGLISDEFVEKLAGDLAHLIEARESLTKQAFAEELAQAFGAAKNMAQSMGFFKSNPTLGQRILGGLTSMSENPLGQHLLIGGALGGAQMVKNVLTKAMDNMTMNASYSQMLQQFPELQKADPALVHRTFLTIQQYAPSVAKNPTVSGTFVKGILQYPDAAITPEHVNSLVNVERQMQGLQQPGLLGEMATGAARGLGQSAVNTFAPDPLRVREVKLKEEEGARRARMENWQKGQMVVNMLGTGANMLGTGANIAKNVHEMQSPSGFPVESLQDAAWAYEREHGGQGAPNLAELLKWVNDPRNQLRAGRR